MLKRVSGKKLSRDFGARAALRRSLVRALVTNGVLITTLAKAKAVQPMVEKLMTKVKAGTLTARRLVLARLGNDRATTDKLFGEYKELAKSRQSGFTRIVKLTARKGDRAKMARLEFVKNENRSKDENNPTKSKRD